MLMGIHPSAPAGRYHILQWYDSACNLQRRSGVTADSAVQVDATYPNLDRIPRSWEKECWSLADDHFT